MRSRYRLEDSSGLGDDSRLHGLLISLDEILDKLGFESWQEVHKYASIRQLLAVLFRYIGHPADRKNVTSYGLTKLALVLNGMGEDRLAAMVMALHDSSIAGNDSRLLLMYVFVNLGLFKSRESRKRRSIDDPWMSDPDHTLPWETALQLSPEEVEYYADDEPPDPKVES